MDSLLPDLRGQIAIVTGASRGIGREIARQLGGCGAHVIVAARNRGDLDSLCEEIRAASGGATPVTTDMSEPESLRELFAHVDAEHRGRLDILINNAGIGSYGPIVDYEETELDRLYNVNLRGTFVACQEALRRMIPAQRGYVVNIASVVGVKGYERQAGYTATKHGVVGLTKTLAIEAQPHGIRTTVICSGGVDTELISKARPDLDRSSLMQPEDIARAVLFLLALPERATIDCISMRRFGSPPW